MIQPRVNHQVTKQIHIRPMLPDQARPLMDIQQEFIPEPADSPSLHRPAGESFDCSDGKQHRATKRARNNEFSPHSYQTQKVRLPLQHEQVTTSSPVPRSSFNINVLKRAVSSNLPCFFINFDPTIERNRIPSSTQVAILRKKVFETNHLPVHELSMCVQAGDRRFKFAVGDKADFLALYNWSWPCSIEEKKVEVFKPRSLPDCLSLVVRYIPMEISIEDARMEVSKAILSAVAFTAIRYQHRQRPLYDLRFSV